MAALTQIFFPGSQSATNVTLRLVQVQNLPCLRRQGRIYLE
jgi:hypothetical protein